MDADEGDSSWISSGGSKPGVTRERAEQELTAILRRGPGESQEVSCISVPLKDE